MPDWARHVRPRLSSLRLSPTREIEIVEELSQHLDDRWRELMAGGASPDEATQLTLGEFRDGNLLERYMAPLRQTRLPAPMTPGAPSRFLLSDLWGGSALCRAHVAEAAWLRERCRPDACAGNRGQHRDFQPAHERSEERPAGARSAGSRHIDKSWLERRSRGIAGQ